MIDTESAIEWFNERATKRRDPVKPGMRFGRLLVVEEVERTAYNARRWRCKCDCGAETVSFQGGLASGGARSCGCINKERMRSGPNRTHGMSKSKEYDAWLHARARCYSPNTSQYKNYGGRGITVCERWSSFENFHADMGDAPSKDHSLDRIDPNGNYEPANCRWATWRQQQRNRTNNRMLVIDGEEKSLAEWCEIRGANYARACARLALGMDEETALQPGLMKKGPGSGGSVQRRRERKVMEARNAQQN